MTTMINLYEFSKESKAVINTEVRVNIMVLVHLQNYKNTCYLCVYSVLMIQELPSFCYHENTSAHKGPPSIERGWGIDRRSGKVQNQPNQMIALWVLRPKD